MADLTKRGANALFGKPLGYQVRDCDALGLLPRCRELLQALTEAHQSETTDPRSQPFGGDFQQRYSLGFGDLRAAVTAKPATSRGSA
jgi:hypothetical protein